MTTRELWHNIMHYGEFDRVPVVHWRGWDETHERWEAEGFPGDAVAHRYFDTVPMWSGVGVNLDLLPFLDAEVLEETDEYTLFRDIYGVVQKDWKHKSCIPHFTDFTLKGAKEWPDFKDRLQPDEGRMPPDLEGMIKTAQTSGAPIVIGTASLMGWIRNWMGVVNMSYLACEEPDVFADMVDTITDLVCWGFDQVIPEMDTVPDMGFGWEDICGKNGPLVSPAIFRACVAPGYRKIRDALEGYGVRLYGIDTDGHIEPLLRDWLDAGVNVQFPVEIGTWKADPMRLRKEYGKELRIIGGIDKLQLEHGRAAIDAEIQRRVPLMKDGGFVPMPDHLITPGTPLADYEYYLSKIRALRF